MRWCSVIESLLMGVCISFQRIVPESATAQVKELFVPAATLSAAKAEAASLQSFDISLVRYHKFKSHHQPFAFKVATSELAHIAHGIVSHFSKSQNFVRPCKDDRNYIPLLSVKAERHFI